VVDWQPVFIDIEGAKFSTWRGIPRHPQDYVVIGHFFVNGIKKPTAEQTADIRAIRKDLIAEQDSEFIRLVWKETLPKAILTLWDAPLVNTFHDIPTGAFVSKAGE
jgi:hypothetical protein